MTTHPEGPGDSEDKEAHADPEAGYPEPEPPIPKDEVAQYKELSAGEQADDGSGVPPPSLRPPGERRDVDRVLGQPRFANPS